MKTVLRTEKLYERIAEALEAGGVTPIDVEPLSVSENGTTTAPTGKAYSPVTVNVTPALQSKDVTMSSTPLSIAHDDGYYGLSQVTVRAEQKVLSTPTLSFNSTTGVVTASITQSAGWTSGTKTATLSLPVYNGESGD